MRKVVSNLLLGIVVCLGSYLLVANITHVFYLNEREEFDFSNNKSIENIKSDLEMLETKNDAIYKLDNSIFTKMELEELVLYSNDIIDHMKESPILTYSGKKNLSLRDLLMMDLSSDIPTIANLSILKILAKYDNTINNYIEEYKYEFVKNAYTNDFMVQELYQAYRYQNTLFNESEVFQVENERILARIYNLGYLVKQQQHITDLVLEIGGGNNE